MNKEIDHGTVESSLPSLCVYNLCADRFLIFILGAGVSDINFTI